MHAFNEKQPLWRYHRDIEALGQTPRTLRAAYATKALERGCGNVPQERRKLMAAPAWFVEIVRVTSRTKQQEVLTLFEGIAGVSVWGVSTGPDHFVGFWCVDNLMRSAAKVLLADIDQECVYSYASDLQKRSHITPGYPSGAWTESLN